MECLNHHIYDTLAQHDDPEDGGFSLGAAAGSDDAASSNDASSDGADGPPDDDIDFAMLHWA